LQKKLYLLIWKGFGAWGILGLGVRVGRVIFVKRAFPELVWRSVQNLVEIGKAVCP